jgi:ABC-type multidrug transport system fused ATPase/permease subunit
MWKTTAPYLGRTLRNRKRAALSVVAGGIVAGSIATTKSIIESSLISAIADAVQQHDVQRLLQEPLVGFGAPDRGDRVADMAIGLLPGLTLLQAIPFYVAVSIIGAGIVVVTAMSRETLSREMFSNLYRAGIDSAFAREEVPSETREPGGLAVSVQQGAGAVAGAYAFVIDAAQYVFALATVLLVLTRASIWFAACCLGVTVLLALVSLIQGKHLAARREEFDRQRRQLLAETDDTLVNRDVLLAHERRDSSVARLRASSYELATIDKHLSVRERAYDGMVNLVEDFGRISVFIVVLVAAAAGARLEEVGDTYFFVSIFARLMAPVRNIFNSYDGVRRSMSTSGTLITLLEPDSRPNRGTGLAVPTDLQVFGTMDAELPKVAAELRDVSYTYTSDEPDPLPSLEHCTLHVPRGGVTLIVGRSGAGKTTISRLLLGFLTPTRGQAVVLGKDTRDLDHEDLLASMSYLAQVGHVIHGTVEANLFASPERDRDALRIALQNAGLARNADEADEMLRKDAHDLSEGQKQRLALARILVDDSPLVILDEPLAGVDAFTFSEVRPHLHAWLRSPDRTVVLVTHRLAFASAATHVVVLGDRGHVLEEGDPRDLAGRPDGLFALLLETARAELRPATST